MLASSSSNSTAINSCEKYLNKNVKRINPTNPLPSDAKTFIEQRQTAFETATTKSLGVAEQSLLKANTDNSKADLSGKLKDP